VEIYSLDSGRGQWRSKGGNGGTRPGAHQHTSCSDLKMRFKQKLRPKYAEKCAFLEKTVKNRLSVGGTAPEPRLPPAAGDPSPDPRVVTFRLPLQLYRIHF